jgi:hypothetical protein
MGATFLAAPLAEVLFNKLYISLFGVPLWTYKILPVGSGHTSLFSPVIWSVYGLGIYLIHQKLQFGYFKKSFLGGLIMAIEGPLYEIAANLLFITLFGSYLFYYWPADMWHLTSFQVVPIYFLCGWVAALSLPYLRHLVRWEGVAITWCLAVISMYLLSLH